MKPLVVIPARGGSKGIPGKNIKLLGGKPLIQYTLQAAQEVFDNKLICVSTDDPKIREVVESLGIDVPFLRPSELATDEAGSIGVLLNAVMFYEAKGYFPEIIILLQPTSPFRTGIHITEALKLFDDQCDMVVSVKETKSNPYSVLFEENILGLLEKSKKGSFTRRQDCPIVWELNGAIYIIKIESLKKYKSFEPMKIKKFPMSEYFSFDIDTPLDWDIAQSLIANN